MIERLRQRAGYGEAYAQLECDPCAAHLSAYRLADPLEPAVCGLHLRDGWRLAFTMQPPERPRGRRRVIVLRRSGATGEGCGPASTSATRAGGRSPRACGRSCTSEARAEQREAGPATHLERDPCAGAARRLPTRGPVGAGGCAAFVVSRTHRVVGHGSLEDKRPDLTCNRLPAAVLREKGGHRKRPLLDCCPMPDRFEVGRMLGRAPLRCSLRPAPAAVRFT